jgi:hypothetical protein
VPGLTAGLQDSNSSTVARCAETLLRIDAANKDAKDVILRLLRNKFPSEPDDLISREEVARSLAVGVIAKFGEAFKDARPDLIALLRESDESTCEQVALGLKGIGPQKPDKAKP